MNVRILGSSNGRTSHFDCENRSSSLRPKAKEELIMNDDLKLDFYSAVAKRVLSDPVQRKMLESICNVKFVNSLPADHHIIGQIQASEDKLGIAIPNEISITDEDKELLRTRLKNIEKELEKINKQINNAGWIANVPKEVVEKTKKRQQELNQKMINYQNRLV